MRLGCGSGGSTSTPTHASSPTLIADVGSSRRTEMTTEGAADHINALAVRYTGEPYQWYGGRDQVRLKVTVRPDSVHAMG